MFMILPNIIIAGVPKTGTSSLFDWLVAHPDVSGSSIKETFYLMDQDNPLIKPKLNYYTNGLEGYQTYFKHCPPESRFIVEGTTHYLYQKTALEVLATFPQQPHIIVMLRKPSARIYSSYQFTQNNLGRLDRNITFSKLIDIIQNQPLETLKKSCHPVSAYVLKNDIKYSCYIDYLDQWLAKFPQDKIHVFLLEDIKKDNQAFIKNVAQRIGLDAQFYNDYQFDAKNQSFFVKNYLIHKTAQQIASLIPTGGIKKTIKQTYLSLMKADKPVSTGLSEEDKQTLAKLDEYFRPFNQRLAETFNLDLTPWN